MTTILAVSGSLRSQSSNTRLVQAIAGLAPPGIKVEIYNGIAQLPHFNPELEGEPDLVAVEQWRTQLQAADGVLFCTPEYAHGVPGTLKNALDWIVSSGEFMHKPTAVISASPSPDGGDKANASLVQTLRVMMADIQEEAILCIPAISAKINAEGKLTDTSTEIALRSVLQALIPEEDCIFSLDS
ncbi:NADPH-dependent FMN reductase [Acaryochloris marina]|uniref:NADPH-dependent FMN reductase n=1 Tax=Acaryochloris marina TaxID=155978 RepID=UPI001BAF77DA|nr:NAD(P)H-dependent oxidoreductase [Acaryochloris marina]QUY42309.1 NAD(P)H-dependent oxidoreductase [Acaryochloris marina S15]